MDNLNYTMKVVRPGNDDPFCGSYIEYCEYCGTYEDSSDKTHRGCIKCKYGYQIDMFKTETIDGDSYYFSKCVPDKTQLIFKVRDGIANDPKCNFAHCKFCLRRPDENGNYQYGCVACQNGYAVISGDDNEDSVFARCESLVTEKFTLGPYAERKRFQIVKLTFFYYAIFIA